MNMESPKLSAERRTVVGKQIGQLRRSGKLPAVLYGPGVDSMPIQIDAREAARVLRRVGSAELVDLTVDGVTRKVLLQDIQRHSMRGNFEHIDFYAVDMARTLRTHIPVHLVGASYAVASLSGVLVRGLTDIEIECLPGDLITAVDVDLSELKEIGSAVYVRDLYTPKTVKVLTGPDDLIVRIMLAKEEDLTQPAAPATAEVEVIEKGKTEEEGEAEAE
jgi:large subunit ribosomal protein L25